MSMQINIYRNAGVWAYALFSHGEYDHSDTIDAESEAQAEAEVLEMFPGAEVRRVDDTNE